VSEQRENEVVKVRRMMIEQTNKQNGKGIKEKG
jgi:hypothetical protein